MSDETILQSTQYTIKKDYEDIAVVSKIEQIGEEEYYLVSDIVDSFLCKLKYTIYDLKGEILLEKSQDFNNLNETSQKIIDYDIAEEIKNKDYVVHFEWNDNNGILKERWFSHISKDHKKANHCDLKFNLEDQNKEKKTIVLKVENSKFIQDFWISSDVLGVSFSDNFLDFLPGKHAIEIKYINEDFNLNQLQYYWR